MSRVADVLRARRLALAAMLAEGGLPRPEQFRRAGLPVLVRASHLVAPADEVEARETAEAREWREHQRRRLSHPGF